MMGMQVGQLLVGIVAVMIPWIVISIALRRAHGAAGRSLQLASVNRLLIGTVVGVSVVGPLGMSTDPPSRVFAATLVICVLAAGALGWAALRDISQATARQFEIDSAVREADLSPRRVHDHLSTYVRAIPGVIATAGLGILTWRLTLPHAERRALVPILFGAGAMVFALLFDALMRQEVRAGRVGVVVPHLNLRHSVRTIFAWECSLVVGFVAASHWLLDADWTEAAATAMLVTATMAVAGAAGCAFVLARDLTRPRYRVRAEP